MTAIDPRRDATSDAASTTGRLTRNWPRAPESSRSGRYATMFVIVANRVARSGLVGPAAAARTGGGAGGGGGRQGRRVRHDVRDRRERDRALELGGPEPRRDNRRVAVVEVALDG